MLHDALGNIGTNCRAIIEQDNRIPSNSVTRQKKAYRRYSPRLLVNVIEKLAPYTIELEEKSRIIK